MKKRTVFEIAVERRVTVGNAQISDDTGNPINLPAPIFILSDYTSNYQQTLAKFLDTKHAFLKSLTLTTDNNGVILTYANIGDTVEEQIRITLDGRSYVTTLNFTRAASLLLSKPKVTVDDALQSAQFENPYYYVEVSGLTQSGDDFFKPRYFEPDVVPNSTIRDIDAEISVDNEHGICIMVAPNSTDSPIVNGVTWKTTLVVMTEEVTNMAAGQKQ